jgi:lactoylglutathione lyase
VWPPRSSARWGIDETRRLRHLREGYADRGPLGFLLYRRSDFEKMTSRRFGYAKGMISHYEIALSVENFAAVDEAYARVVAAGAVPVLDRRVIRT